MIFRNFTVDEGVFLMASRARVGNFRRLLEAYDACRSKVNVEVIVGRDDPQYSLYNSLTLPPQWTVLFVPGDPYLSEKMNSVLPRHRNRKWIGCTDDSTYPETEWWCEKLLEALPAWGRVTSYNGYAYNNPYNAHIIDGALVHRLGWVTYPHCPHTNGDVALFELCAELGGCFFQPAVVLRHEHPLFGSGVPDETYNRQREVKAADAEGFKHFKKYKAEILTWLKISMETENGRK